MQRISKSFCTSLVRLALSFSSAASLAHAHAEAVSIMYIPAPTTLHTSAILYLSSTSAFLQRNALPSKHVPSRMDQLSQNLRSIRGRLDPNGRGRCEFALSLSPPVHSLLPYLCMLDFPNEVAGVFHCPSLNVRTWSDLDIEQSRQIFCCVPTTAICGWWKTTRRHECWVEHARARAEQSPRSDDVGDRSDKTAWRVQRNAPASLVANNA